MIVAILADEKVKKEILTRGVAATAELIWVDSIRSLGIIEADAYFDLEFNFDTERIAQLKRLVPRPVIVNSVVHTSNEIGNFAVRINAWPTMINRGMIEISASNVTDHQKEIEKIFNSLEWNYQVVPDITGMITPRIVSMIVNEAWYSLGEKISTREEIDTAMKLGTNYPYGPFEWGDKIGLEKIRTLLRRLGSTDQRYTIAPLLNED